MKSGDELNAWSFSYKDLNEAFSKALTVGSFLKLLRLLHSDGLFYFCDTAEFLTEFMNSL